MDYFVASGPDLLDLSYHPGSTAPTNTPTVSQRRIHRRHLLPANANASIPLLAESSRKFVIGGFLPLPSISASPVCTPTSSISRQDSVSDDSYSKGTEEYTTAPSSPSASELGGTSPPTWISTPPTPPPRMVRRSVTCFPRPISQVPPSASFPATTQAHRNDYFMKRHNSIPSMPQYPTTSRSQHDYDHNSSKDVTLGKILGPPLSRSKPLFHIPTDPSTDTEDSSPPMSGSPHRLHDELSAEGSWSDHDPEDFKQLTKSKDDIRRYHALKELLDTEVGYLLDLRALVTVYLRIVPTLVCRPPPSTTFGRASSSFSSSPWVNAHSHPAAAAAASASTSVISDSHAASSVSLQSKDPPNPGLRYLFTDVEVEVLTRNAEEILQLHEQFVGELRKEMAPLGFNMEAYQRGDPAKTSSLAIQNTDAAIRILSTKFAAEASRFASYQTFCTGHPEALDLVRKIVAQRPAEWDAFEQRSSTLVDELELCTTVESPSATLSEGHGSPSLQNTPVRGRSRTASMSSLEGAVRTWRSRTNGMQSRDFIAAPAESPVTKKEKSTPRLAFVDYMIKPVQRICKYPLILDQLRSSKPVLSLSAHPSDVDVIVESAKQAMKHVASAVDDARHRQDVAMRSALIASRIALGPPMSSIYPASQPLTQPFLSSLGNCLLAGSLDVIHHSAKPAGSNLVVKYMGAFLYLGGFLILVKVTKGKVYEPKHWFSLVDFDVTDADETDATLPFSLHISCKDHRFELAAACQREKDAWLRCIRESRNHQPTWISEPTSSLCFDGKGDLIPSALDDGPFECVNALPTIQSIPELAGHNTDYPGLTDTLLMAFNSDNKHRKSARRDLMVKQDSDPLSRRSSTTSVKGMFSPLTSDSDTIVIRRYSTSARARVDQGLQDIISQLCMTARSQAGIKDEELFPAPKATKGAFVRSQSGLSISGMAAKSRLTRHESVRVLRRRSLVDRPDCPSKKSSVSGRSTMSGRQSTGLSMTAMSDSDAARSSSSQPHSQPSTPSLMSSHTCSSPKSSVRSSILFTSTIKPSRDTKSEHKPTMKTSRSLVTGVKELLFPQSRSSSALSLGQAAESTDIETYGAKGRAVGSIKRWAKGSIHRRTRSAPEEEPFILPDIQKLPALSIPSLDLPGLEFGTTIPLSTSPKSYVTPPQTPERLSLDKNVLRPALLTSPVRCQSPTNIDNHAPKHLSLLRRLKA